MKIAISSQDQTLHSLVDERFGRAQYFLILDASSGEVEFLDNSKNCNAAQGAGINAVQMLTDKNVTWVLTGHIGPKALAALDVANLKYQEGFKSSMLCIDALRKFSEDKQIKIPNL